MSPAARLIAGRVIPERSGYYLGHRMAEARAVHDALPLMAVADCVTVLSAQPGGTVDGSNRRPASETSRSGA